jgi:hypothetical protein
VLRLIESRAHLVDVSERDIAKPSADGEPGLLASLRSRDFLVLARDSGQRFPEDPQKVQNTTRESQGPASPI